MNCPRPLVPAGGWGGGGRERGRGVPTTRPSRRCSPFCSGTGRVWIPEHGACLFLPAFTTSLVFGVDLSSSSAQHRCPNSCWRGNQQPRLPAVSKWGGPLTSPCRRETSFLRLPPPSALPPPLPHRLFSSCPVPSPSSCVREFPSVSVLSLLTGSNALR